jgi:hypothetical protein
MLMELNDHISSFSRQARRTIQSVLSESKLEKAEIGRLINKISSFSSASDYIPTLVSNMMVMQKEPLIDLFRDVDLRIKTNYDISKSLAMLKSSMSTIFSGEIQKIEKDILYLESYINNWSFLSGEDDLYNYNFVENFDNTINSNAYDSNQFTFPDRNGLSFDISEYADVDPITGTLKFSSEPKKILINNFKEKIKEIKFYTNFSSEYISSNTSIENIFDNSSSKIWNMTVKSPFLIESSIFDREEFKQYANTVAFDSSAQVAVEIILNSEVVASTIRINPNVTKGLYLIQGLVESGIRSNSDEIEQGNSKKNIILNKPIYLDKSIDIDLPGDSFIKSIILFFAQKDYVRTRITPIQSELNSKMINQFTKEIRKDRKKRHDTLQDLVIKFFIKDYAKDYILKNKKLYNYDYTYYYPTDLSKKSVGVLKEIKNNKYYSDIDSYNKFKNTTILSNIIFSIVSYSIGANIRASIKNTYLESNLKDLAKPVSSFASGGLVPLGDSNSITENIHFIQESFYSIDQKSVIDLLNNIESQNQYEYMFSIKNIGIFLVDDTVETQVVKPKQRSVYISKRIPLSGMPLNVKMMANYFSELSRLELDQSSDKTSAEFSVSIKDNPNTEEDWIPIMPFNDSIIRTEILFPNSKGETILRFIPNVESISIYESGVRRDSQTLIVNGKNITILAYNSAKTYVASYTPANERACKEIPLISRSLANPILVAASTNGSNGERFEKTDIGNRVQLSKNPHVDYGKFANAKYSLINGTITTSNSSFGNFDYSSYSPVKVILDDGTVALNLTNYIVDNSQKESFYNTELLLFLHNGQSILFNKPINKPFKVLYHHIADIFRYRIILRNLNNTTENYSVDRLLFKFSIDSQDSIMNTFIKYDNRYKNRII